MPNIKIEEGDSDSTSFLPSIIQDKTFETNPYLHKKKLQLIDRTNLSPKGRESENPIKFNSSERAVPPV